MAQLDMLRNEFKGHVNCLNDIVDLLKRHNVLIEALFSEVVKLTKLLLVMPATDAVSERSFRAMWVIKNDLRTNSS